jgi:threonine/homoserine/homoserine lactone efflux protein
MTTALLTGLGLGFLVAAQVGPISLLAARSVLLGRLITGIMIGLGAATTDTAYGALGLAGAASLLRISGLHLALGLLGAAVLIALGALALRSATRTHDQVQPSTDIIPAPRAYLMALAGTAANPLTIASWAAVFAAASTARTTHATGGAALLLAGIGLGTTSWFIILSTAMLFLRRYAGRRFQQTVNVVSGLGLIAFGIALASQTLVAAP